MAVTGVIMVAYLDHPRARPTCWCSRARRRSTPTASSSTGPAGRSGRLRLVLFVAVVLHIVAAVQLTGGASAARPVAYAAGREPQVSTSPRGRSAGAGC